MTPQIQRERATQARVIKLFCEELGYRFLGEWSERPGNSNIELGVLTSWLHRRGYDSEQIARALYLLTTLHENENLSLYDRNQRIHQLLTHGVGVKLEAGKNSETVHLIDWEKPEQNDFAIAEEVTLRGVQERRPDLVLYVNGIAVGVIELKRASVEVGEAIRQLCSLQEHTYSGWFFSTVQILIAGNDSAGLRYGTIGTEEKFYLSWKEDEHDDRRIKLDKYLLKLCDKSRLLELIHDFVLFDGGRKKLPRVHQYMGIKAAQRHVERYEGGIIWHTQGSGKSIVMVLLARWILANKPNARVVILTDRTELDKQISDVFTGAGEAIHRTSSGSDLMLQLGKATPRLICSLVHKFGRRTGDDFESFIQELRAQPSPAFGELFVFVDECHRTQSGRLHQVMKALLPQAVFIGFTGTPLLKTDKQTSMEVFGRYIHTYKYKEAVDDRVVLDLVYEARDIDQHIKSPEKVDAWFEAKTRTLNAWQKDHLKEHWGTMQRVLSSRARMIVVMADIVHDFDTHPRLSGGRGNAMLVASSIYEACAYYELFQGSPLRSRCAVVTSFNPQAVDLSKESTGADTETERQYIKNVYDKMLAHVAAEPGKTRAETHEEKVKELFIKQPVAMSLLIVVDKLLTGFDAPSCSALYLDKKMQDHGLFQAICRTNRLDTPDKEFGTIIDYKDSFRRVQDAISVYSSELDRSDGGTSPDVLLKERLAAARQRLEGALEAIELACEGVPHPRTEQEFIRYFCGNSEIPGELDQRETLRVGFYKGVAALTRAWAALTDEMGAAGFTRQEADRIKVKVEAWLRMREAVRLASGEHLDLKAYEADMRYLIDHYIQADDPRRISGFSEVPLVELMVHSGIAAMISTLPEGVRANPEAVAEVIEQNVRKRIIRSTLADPAHFERMSLLLGQIIAERKAKALAYEEYLKKIEGLIKLMELGYRQGIPSALNTPGKEALYNNLGKDEALALKVDEAVRRVRPDGWRGVLARERVIKAELLKLLGSTEEVERMFLIIQQHKEY